VQLKFLSMVFTRVFILH